MSLPNCGVVGHRNKLPGDLKERTKTKGLLPTKQFIALFIPRRELKETCQSIWSDTTTSEDVGTAGISTAGALLTEPASA